jgi:hypothetical protein
MSVYLHVTLHIRPGRLGRFVATLQAIRPIVEAQGWQLLGAWTTVVGRLNVVVDLWRLPDANAVPTAIGALLASAGWPELERELAECVEQETLQLMAPLPFSPLQ